MDLISEHGIFLFAYDFSMEMLTKKRKKKNPSLLLKQIYQKLHQSHLYPATVYISENLYLLNYCYCYWNCGYVSDFTLLKPWFWKTS